MMKPFSAHLHRSQRIASGLLAIAAATLAAGSFPLAAQTPTAAAPSASAGAKTKQPIFATPEAGIDALITALRANDARQLARLLGPGHQRIIDSGYAAELIHEQRVRRAGQIGRSHFSGRSE